MKTPQLKGLDFSSEEIKKNIEENGILRLSISLSTTCNLRCPFCYADAGKKSENELSLDGIFDVIKQAKKLGAKTITLVGGEPMIYPKVKEVISLINKNDMTPLIFTNGTQMTKEFAKFLYDNNASIIVKFNSLDNPEIQDEMVGGFKGSYDKVQKTVALLIEAGLNKSKLTRLGIETVISHANLSQIPKIFRFARENNVYPYIELVTPAGRGRGYQDFLTREEAKKIFYELLEIDEEEFDYSWMPRPPQVATTCKYFFTAITINSNGKVQPCPGVGIELGDIKREKLSAILKKPQTRKIRNIRENIMGKCKTCPYHSDCYGCRGAAFNLTGNVFSSYDICWLPEDNSPLKEIRIETTQKCNQKCSYCYVQKFTKTEGVEISFEEIEKVIDDAIQQGLETVSLTGGEPFLKYDLVKKIVKNASDKGLNTGILTNGTMATEDMINELKELGLTWLRVSLDGSNEKINSSCRDKADFNRIIKTINSAKSSGLNVIIRTTVTNKNVHDLKDMIKLAEELKVDRIDLQPLFPTNNKQIDKELLLSVDKQTKAATELLKLKRELTENPLEVVLYSNWFEFLLPEYKGQPVYMSKCGRTFCLIDANGNVKSCGPNTKTVGNIREKSILEIWNNSEHFKQIRKNERFGICKACEKAELCITCPSATYNLHKELNHAPPLCPRVRESEDSYYH